MNEIINLRISNSKQWKRKAGNAIIQKQNNYNDRDSVKAISTSQLSISTLPLAGSLITAG